MQVHSAADIARRLLAARKAGAQVPWREVLPAGIQEAREVQDATVAGLGGCGGWKVGAAGPAAEPGCAPLPCCGIVADGALPADRAGWHLRGIEVEVAVRMARDITAHEPPSRAELQASVDAVLPAVEIVETRLAGWRDSEPLAQVADLQSHGALILGAPQGLPNDLDLRDVVAYLAFDGQPVATARGGNPAQDVWRLLGWLAVHCTLRGAPLRAGQVVTTGSCTGLLFAPEGARVQAELRGLGRVDFQF
jgi:2-keto-4-pentenoate hydratase